MSNDELELLSAYGDGWYNGFLRAQEIAVNNEPMDFLDDYSKDDVLHLSEHAEMECNNSKRMRWSVEEPKEQGFYWHWSGSHDDAPIVLSVLKSGGINKCFVSAGQYGIKNAIYCKEYGGLWAMCASPKLPDVIYVLTTVAGGFVVLVGSLFVCVVACSFLVELFKMIKTDPKNGIKWCLVLVAMVMIARLG